MKKLREFRPETPNTNPARKTSSKKKTSVKRSKKSTKGSNFSTIALVAATLFLSVNHFKKKSMLSELAHKNKSLTEKIAAQDIERMNYMADKKLQEVEKDTLKLKKDHIKSLEGIIKNNSQRYAQLETEFSKLKALKVSDLEYKNKIAQLEKSYEDRLNEINKSHTEMITNMGRRMMASKGQAPSKFSQSSKAAHTVKFRKPASVQMNNNNSVKSKSNWSDTHMEF